MTNRKFFALHIAAFLLGGVLGSAMPTFAAPTKIANGPLASAANPSNPNVMFILDDSGSMRSQFGDDYSNRNLFVDGNLTSPCRRWGRSSCLMGDPPYMSSDFNRIYYNPAIRYRPGVNADGSSMPNADPTAAPTDPYGVTFENSFGSQGKTTTANLVTEYPDRVWCSSSSASATDAALCQTIPYPNDDYNQASAPILPAWDCNNLQPSNMPWPYLGGTNICHFSAPISHPFRGGPPYYYKILSAQYCADVDLTNCVNATSPTTVLGVNYFFPATVRWCDSPTLANCQGRRAGAYVYPNISGTQASAVIPISVGAFYASATQNWRFPMISVDGVNLFTDTTGVNSPGSPSSPSIAANAVTIANTYVKRINEYSSNPNYKAVTYQIGAINYLAIYPTMPGTGNGRVVTVEQVTYTNPANGTTFTNTPPAPITMAVPGGGSPVPPLQFERVYIVPSAAPFPKAPGRTDCAAGTCTYNEELQNFANWYSYYRTRLMMMKTAVGRAFATLDASTRVGFMTIHPYPVSGGMVAGPLDTKRFLAIDNFNPGAGQQRETWYAKLYGTNAQSNTPLRQALAIAGRYYAGLGTSASGLLNSGMGPSPIQTSCQQNYAILSTDGYWNNGEGVPAAGGMNIDGTASVPPSADSSLGTGPGQVPRPLYDGGLPAPTDGAGTLADVAQYYYATDLRPDLANQVPTTPRDPANHQHMTTFTIGLGVDGILKYERNYETSTDGDFQKLKVGTLDWPTPSADKQETVDDLWHAAVNGRGKYFSAQNPQDVIDGLNEALTTIATRTGAGAAAATSNLQPVAGDDLAFTAEYLTGKWIGDLTARKLDLNTGLLSATKEWSAQALLESRPYASRTIWMPGGGASGLKPFQWANLSATEKAYFNPTAQLPQATGWTAGQQTTATGETLVNYLRGDRSNDITLKLPMPDTDLYRTREKILGDIVNAQPTYVRASPLSYNDRGFSEFNSCTAGTAGAGVSCPPGLSPGTPRIGTVFAAANDGMLHAFDTEGPSAGEERWAFIPSMVLPNLHKLASTAYPGNHQYFVDGSPVIGDICIAADCQAASVSGADWRTILVGGLNAGGRGFYALDITDPTAGGTKLLWEFKVRDAASCGAPVVGSSSDCDLGYSFSNPIITKRKSDGKWVVLIASGYNNFAPGDGNGYLYVLDAATGKVLNKVGLPASAGALGGSASPTTCGTPYCDADPLGLTKINIRLADNVGDNTALYAYGGDLKGNLWRFDLTDAANSYPEPALIATLKDSKGNGQPITTRPEVGMVQTNVPAVFVGTGKYLGTGDSTDTQQQTIYAIRADLTSTIDPRAGDLVQQTLSSDTAAANATIRTVNSMSVDWSANKGWYIDLPVSGERVNVDPSLQVGTLVIASNVPSTDSCVVGGYGYLNQFDFKTGKAVETAANLAASQKVTSSLIAGITVVKLPGNKLVTITTTADNQQLAYNTPTTTTGVGSKRVSWREIIIDN